MKIIQLITDENLRGAQVFARQLSRHLIQRGHTVTVIALYQAGRESTEVTDEIIELKGKKGGGLRLSLVLKLAKQLRAHQPDIIQANGSDTLKYALAARLVSFNKSKVVYRNISMASQWLTGGLQLKFYRWMFSKVDHVITLTPETNVNFIETYKFPKGRISIVPIGTDIPEGDSRMVARKLTHKNLGLPPETKVLLHVGAFTAEKNHRGLLRIFQEVRKQSSSVVLVIIGSGPMLEEIKRFSNEMKMGDAVRFLGQRSDINEWMSGADVLILPSLIEGLPGVILEAMAAHLPVVAYDVGGIKHVVQNQVNGFLVAKEDEQEFTKRTIELLQNNELREMFAQRAFEDVKERYSMIGITVQFEEVFASLRSQ